MYTYVGRDPLWDWLGLYPVAAYLIANLMLIGLVCT